MDNRDLIHRINRVQGQLEAIKKMLSEEDVECMKIMQLLKASNNAIKKFGEAYMSSYLAECIAKKTPGKDIETKLKEIINASFTM